MATVIKSVNGELTQKTEGLGTLTIGLALSPLKMFSSTSANAETTYYNEKEVGFAILGSLVGGAVVGRKFGEKIPLLNAVEPAL